MPRPSEVRYAIDLARIESDKDHQDDLSIDALVSRSAEMTSILRNQETASVYKKLIGSYGKSAATYASSLSVNFSPEAKINSIHKRAALKINDDPDTTSADISLLRSISDYIVAMCPDEWKKSCHDNNLAHRTYQAEPKHMSWLWSNRPLTSGVLLRRSDYHIKKAEEKARTIVQPEEGTSSALYPMTQRINDVALLMAYHHTIRLLVNCKKLCTKSEEKTIESFNRRVEKAMQESRIASHAMIGIFGLSEDMLALARRIQQRGHNENIRTLLSNNIKSFEDVKGEVTENWIILSDVLESKGYFNVIANGEGITSPGTDEIANDLERQERYRTQQEEKNLKEANERALYDELAQSLVQLNARAEQLSLPWLVSSKTIKNRGLKGAVGALVNGVTSGSGIEIIEGRSKPEAYELVGDIEYLRKLIETNNIDGFYEQIDLIHEKEEKLKADIQQLIERANQLPSHLQNNLMANLPVVAEKSLRWEEIVTSWSKFEPLIRSYWPNGDFVATSFKSVFEHTKHEEEVKNIASEGTEQEVNEPIALQQASKEVVELTDDSSVLPREFLHNIAMQLDTVILPPEATLEDLKETIKKMEIPVEQSAKIDWNRLFNLVKIRDDYGGTMYRSKKGSLGNAPPYFVVEIKYEESLYAIAESPVAGNATYIVAEKLAAGTWLEVLSLPKSDARGLGAQRIIHRGMQVPENHLAKIETRLIDLMSVAA